MKNIKGLLKNVGIFLLSLLILGVLNRWYAGGFSTFELKEQVVPTYAIAYVQFTGDYGKIGPSLDAVYTMLSGAGIVAHTGAGIYYDDPILVSGVNLRSDIGAIVPISETKKIKTITGVQTRTIATENSMVIEFPIKNNLSYMIGPMKVYPLIEKHIKKNGYKQVPVTELYDMLAKKIYYIAQITK